MSMSSQSMPHKAWQLAADIGHMSAGSADRYERVWTCFLAYAYAAGVQDLATMTASLCEAFVQAPLAGKGEPSAATSRFRLTVLRSAFSELVACGAASQDPTASLTVPSQLSTFQAYPLFPAEVARLRAAARVRPQDTLRPATVALALAGLDHGEIARSVVADFDLPSSHLRVPGAHRSRTIAVDQPTSQVLLRRVHAQRRTTRRLGQRWEPSVVPLALTRPLSTYPIASIAPSISSNLRRALIAAGAIRPGVRPRSLREYAANAVYAKTGRIEDVATHLGISSLDTARRLIDSDWQQRFGDQVRYDHH